MGIMGKYCTGLRNETHCGTMIPLSPKIKPIIALKIKPLTTTLSPHQLCVVDGAVPEVCIAVCGECRESKHKTAFSKSQWYKVDEHGRSPRCTMCVNADIDVKRATEKGATSIRKKMERSDPVATTNVKKLLEVEALNVTALITQSNTIRTLEKYAKTVTSCRQGSMFKYPSWVVKHSCYAVYGTFVDYLCRHYVHYKIGTEFKDHRAAFIVDQILCRKEANALGLGLRIEPRYTTVFEPDFSVCMLGDAHKTRHESEMSADVHKTQRESENSIVHSYSEIMQISVHTRCLIAHIFNVSLCHGISFGRDDWKLCSIRARLIEEQMLQEIFQFLDLLLVDAKNIVINPIFGSVELKIRGDGDLLIDDILVDFKVSKYSKGANFVDFHQLILYAAGHYFNTKRYIRELIIYNPLLGQRHSISVDKELIDATVNFLMMRADYKPCDVLMALSSNQ